VLPKRRLWALITAAVLLAVTGCSTQGSKGGKVVLRLADIAPTGSLRNQALVQFAKIAGEKSGGKLEIKVFGNGQLGGERDSIEAVSLGTMDITAGSTTLLSTLDPKVGILDLPFLWRDAAHTHKVMNGEVGTALTKGLQAKGAHVLSWMDLGSRMLLTSDRTVKSLDDFKGLKIRVPESDVYVKTFTRLGANPTPMPWGEIYTAMQTNVVTAVEGPPDSLNSSKFQEVAKHGAQTWHMWTGLGLVINEQRLAGLTPDLQQALGDAAKEAADWNNAEAQKSQDAAVKALAAAGVQMTEVDRQPLQKAVEPVWKEIGDKVNGNDLIAKILAAK
jgi:tripartite ATP-independent transporter DctP family solute receptor